MKIKYWNVSQNVNQPVIYKTKKLSSNIFGLIIALWIVIFNDRTELLK